MPGDREGPPTDRLTAEDRLMLGLDEFWLKDIGAVIVLGDAE
jgi:hypothetical protein